MIRTRALLLLLCCLLCAPALAEEEAAPAPALRMEDLAFSGIVFPEATLTDCMEVFGAPISDAMDARSGVITLQYDDMRLEFLAGEDGEPRLEAMRVTGEDIEGPRGLLIEDTRRSVEDRFGVSDDEDADFYACEDEDGNGYALICAFSGDYLTEYLLYRL